MLNLNDRSTSFLIEYYLYTFPEDIEIKNDELRSVVAKLHTVQSEDQNKATALESTQEQLVYVTEQHSQGTVQVQRLQVRGESRGGHVGFSTIGLNPRLLLGVL